MFTWKRLGVVGASAGAGFAVMLCLVVGGMAWYTQQPQHSVITKAPAKAIPAQVLRFVDGTGREVASLDFIPGWHDLSVYDAAGEPFANFVGATKNGYRELTLYSINDHEFLSSATSGGAPNFEITRKDGTSKFIQSKGSPRSSQSVPDWIKVVGAWVFPRTVAEKSLWTLDELIPSQDLKLLDKDGTTFAVLGLGRGGEPTLALFGKDGNVELVWTYSYVGKWPELHLFDEKDIRVSVETAPPASVRLIISEPDGLDGAAPGRGGFYVLDPNTYEEVPKGSAKNNGEIPWLSHKTGPPVLPISLLDQRNNVLWRAP